MLFFAYNGPRPTTAAQLAVTSGTVIKTLLQIAPPAGTKLKVKRWDISFTGFAAAAPAVVELIETDVAATVTAHVASGVPPWGDDTGASVVTLGTAATGYTATAEGTITATRVFEALELPVTQPWAWEYSLGSEPCVAAAKFLRVRITVAAAINVITKIVWDE